jgi:ABC-type glycerol-3-phosphate transport system substrate-binding protein
MKKITFILTIALALAGCNQTAKKADSSSAAETTADANTVNVYYFHGKQRCATCIAVGDVAKATVEKSFAGNKKVVFTEINVSDKTNEALAEKYEVTWNALIIAKGEDSVDITQQAFASALENPQALEDLIKKTISEL